MQQTGGSLRAIMKVSCVVVLWRAGKEEAARWSQQRGSGLAGWEVSSSSVLGVCRHTRREQQNIKHLPGKAYLHIAEPDFLNSPSSWLAPPVLVAFGRPFAATLIGAIHGAEIPLFLQYWCFQGARSEFIWPTVCVISLYIYREQTVRYLRKSPKTLL